MILYIGSEDNSYFVEEIAEKKGFEISCIESRNHIQDQTAAILTKQNVEFMIFEISQYIDTTDEITNEIIRISRANNAKVIILAPGYFMNSKIIVDLYKNNIYNFIVASDLSGMKEQLILCLSDYYSNNKIEELSSFLEEENESENKINENVRLIGVAGSCNRIGTTTQSFQIVKYLMLQGYKVAYLEMNNTGYINNMKNWYSLENEDEEVGSVTFNNIEHFYKMEKISDILKQDYDYLVYDYGAFMEKGFNKTSFLEKDIKIFVLGSSPSEMQYTYDVIKNSFYTDVFYIFNLTSKSDQPEILEMMENASIKTFFSAYTPDPYEYTTNDIYQNIIQCIPQAPKISKKKKWFFRKEKKKNE